MASPVEAPSAVNALLLDGSDNLAWQYPQILADIIIQSSGELQFATPIRDVATGQMVSSMPFATEPDSVTVSAGWNGAGRARIQFNGSTAPGEDAVPIAGVLRDEQIQMQNRAGAPLTTQPVGRLIDMQSPTEYFNANPIDTTVASFPFGAGLRGAATLTDAAMSASNATLSTQTLGGVSRQIATVSMANAGQLTRVARYIKLRPSNASSDPLTWVLREVRMRAPAPTSALAPGAVRARGDQRLTIRKLTFKRPTYVVAASGPTPTSSVTKIFIIPEEPNPWDPTPIPPQPPAPDPVPPPPPPPVAVPLPPVNGGDVPVIFQHGYKAGAGDWNDMQPRLGSQLRIDTRASTVPVEGDLFNAATGLNGQVQALFPNQRAIAIAHSAGGLVARRAAFQDPSKISGLVTVGTPHRGALIAERAPTAVAAFTGLIPSIFLGPPCLNGALDPAGRVCGNLGIVDVSGGAVLALAGMMITTNQLRDARDLEPGSTFVSEVNTPPESYVRVGITHRVPRRWSVAREVGEVLAVNGSGLEWNSPKGQQWADGMSLVHRIAIISFVQATVMIWMLSQMEVDQGRLTINTTCGPSWTMPNAGCGYDPWSSALNRSGHISNWYRFLLWEQSIALSTALTLSIGDYIWNMAVAAGRTSDSFIAAESQAFPNNPGSAIPPVNIESDRSSANGPLVGHLGETHSEMVRGPFQRELEVRFGVRRR
jgi:pimeloyl-ACP methyl ester carboxylesterase